MLFQISLPLLSLALSAAAATLGQRELPAEKDIDHSLYICNEASFEGSCVYYPVELGECNAVTDEFTSGENGVMSAVSGPNNVCTMFSEEGCSGDEIHVGSPGETDLGALDWAGKVRSYQCAAN